MSARDLEVPSWAVTMPARRAHIRRVAALLEHWAEARRVGPGERERWRRAALLHDALKDAPLARLRELAPAAWHVDALRHGPAAAARAAREGETDAGVLDAVRYHSVGFAGWDDVGRMLYLADYLEPGRGFLGPERERLVAQVSRDPDLALREVASRRLSAVLAAGWPLLPESVAFWNALCDASG